MAKSTTVNLPAGQILTITTDASTTATYTRLGNPGDPRGASVSLSASSTNVIGAFANGYFYLLTSSTADGLTYTVTNGPLAADAVLSSNVGNGTKNGATVASAEYGDGVVHKTVLTFSATPISIADDAGVAQYGGVKIYDFPEGSVNIHGAVIKGALTLGATGTIINTFAGGVSLGTVTATTGATLTGTEADILPENDVAAAVAKVATIAAKASPTALTESGGRWFDGTATAIDMFLNFVIDDDASHTAGTGTFTGTVTFTWSNLGDI